MLPSIILGSIFLIDYNELVGNYLKDVISVKFGTEEELVAFSKGAVGKTFGQLGKSDRLLNLGNKGGLGQFIEESYFGYEINSQARPDFEELGVELKVTPFKRNKNGSLSAKERLVLNIIDYMKEANTEFYSSSFWKKNEKLMLFFYEWIPDVNKEEYPITYTMLHRFSTSDLEVIKKDWETIVSKIRIGKAHEISEGDTNYLGACTKGATKESLRGQPFSNIKAMQRAYSLKQSYMTSLVRQNIYKEKLISFTNANELKSKTLDNILLDKFEPYMGQTDYEIAEKIGVNLNVKSKGFVPELISALLGIKGTKLEKIEEFSKANIQFKTIRLEPNGKPKEHMSFETIKFDELVNEEWENSFIRYRFAETKFLFVIFEYKETVLQNSIRKLYFKGVKLWNMPIETIEKEIKQLWVDLREKLEKSLEIKYIEKGGKLIESNNLPKSGFNGVAHIRPKARDGSDKVLLPDGRRITKQCYWLNNTYIKDILG
ncbi:MAG: restriction enzyme [Bacillales bacterium]|jgi:DNA mismatch repair protein MutH|nr:restriction enzyme [Bacillales bacterium]